MTDTEIVHRKSDRQPLAKPPLARAMPFVDLGARQPLPHRRSRSRSLQRRLARTVPQV